MYNGNNINFPNNKELNSIQHLSNDDLFYSNSIQIPKQINNNKYSFEIKAKYY